MQIIVITPPEPMKDETTLCNALFAHGLEVLHLRKPGAGRAEYKEFILRIEHRYRNRIVIHDHYDLAKQYHLKGIHLKYNKIDEYGQYKDIPHISISCHSFNEIETLTFRPAYCFLSPVFDSLSKQGYKSKFTGAELYDKLHHPAGLPPVYALGGITSDNLFLCRQYGFQGVALLGYIWSDLIDPVARFVGINTPFAMSIAGFDPSSGAGVTADLKTFETCGVYGLGVCSAVTFQNQEEYTGTKWMSFEEIQRQCDLQFQKNVPTYIKVGLIENFGQLQRLTEYLINEIRDVKIIWDPILKASAGFVFHHNSESDRKKLGNILKRIYLITPNTNELEQLFGKGITPEGLKQTCLEYNLNILWKGGHNNDYMSCDRLITPERVTEFSVLRGKYEKHGTGCVLSSALVSALAKGFPLADACNKAQLYVSRFIDSNTSKLGYHIIGCHTNNIKLSFGDLSLQYITDEKEGMTICDQVEAVCRGGMRWIQLRIKDATDEEILKEGKLVREICRRYNALFIINDNVHVARQLEADGVHLGKEDMNPLTAREIMGADKIIGATCNTFDDIILRSKQAVDYIGLGPFAFTSTKKQLSPVIGLPGYEKIMKEMMQEGISCPVFAIGGINETDIIPLMQTGIQGIALSGLIKNSSDLEQKTKEIITILNCHHIKS